MPSTPVVLSLGSIVRIAGRRGMGLVVRSEHKVSEDRARGDFYSVDEFDIVKFDATTSRGMLVNPKVTSYYFTEGSMHGNGQVVRRDDVEVLGSAKVQAKVTVDYAFSSAKLA